MSSARRAKVNCEEVVEALRAALVVVDERGQVCHANRAAESLLELGPNRQSPAWPLGSIEEIRSLAASNARGTKRVHRAGRPDQVLGYSATLMASSDVDPSYAVVFQDITEVERLREERDRLMRMAAVSEILPSLLHELKNPLASIGTAVELLLEELAPGKVQGDLHAVLTEIRRMKFTLEGLGSVGRELRSSRHHPIDHAAREVCRVLDRQASSRGITLRCQIADIPLMPLDPGVARAILFNLITNAIHASSAGGQIEVGCSFEEQSRRLCVWVKDNGSGMDEEVLARCQELFFTTKAKGTGIGLALATGAVERAGGYLLIDSHPGVGTRIDVIIPIPSKDQDEDSNRASTKSPRTPAGRVTRSEAAPQKFQEEGDIACHAPTS